MICDLIAGMPEVVEYNGCDFFLSKRHIFNQKGTIKNQTAQLPTDNTNKSKLPRHKEFVFVICSCLICSCQIVCTRIAPRKL